MTSFEQHRATWLENLRNDPRIIAVELIACACCGDLRHLEHLDGRWTQCVHCTDVGGPCPVDGCPIDPSISN